MRAYAKITLDDCCNLDVNRMMRLEAIQEACIKSGAWVWSCKQTGEEIFRIFYHCNTMDKANSYLQVKYEFEGAGRSYSDRIHLVRTYPPYGGVRFWFICPKLKRRVGKLFLMPGSGRFLSRHVGNIRYETQSHGELDRAITKKWKIIKKIKGWDYPMKPKGMHQKTFDRIAEKFFAQEKRCDQMMIDRFGPL